MLEEADVVALLEAIEPLMAAARFAPLERRVRHGLRHVEQVAELDGEQPFGIPGAGVIIEPDATVALLELGESVAGALQGRGGAINSAAILHALRHLALQRRDALRAPRAREELERTRRARFGQRAMSLRR